MEDEISNMADSRFQAPNPTRFYASYFGAAILSGVTSVVGGSILCVTYDYAFSVGGVRFTDYLITLLFGCLFSAAVVLPVSVIIAFPLMVLCRKKSQLMKFLLSVAAGAFCATILAAYFYFVMPEGAVEMVKVVAVGITYGAVFGVVAAQLPGRKTRELI